MIWLVMAQRDDGFPMGMSLDVDSREEGLRTAFAQEDVIRVEDAFALRERRAILCEDVPVREEGHCLVEVGGDRRWVPRGEPEEDWWTEVTPQGIAYQDGWEYDRDTNTVVCMIG